VHFLSVFVDPSRPRRLLRSSSPCSTTVFSHASTVVFCGACSTVLCQPTGQSRHDHAISHSPGMDTLRDARDVDGAIRSPACTLTYCCMRSLPLSCVGGKARLTEGCSFRRKVE
jgi:ribosomal protein S27E